VLIVVTILGLYFGGYIFAALVGAVFAGCYREWDRMVTLKPLTAIGGVLIGMVGLAALAYPLLGPLATLGVIAAAVVVAATEREVWLWRAAGLVFFGFVILALLAVRGTEWDGFLAAFFLGIVVWLTDTGAFFTGRQVGGEKLAPDISPGKTWSGAVGGFAIGTLGGLVFWLFTTNSPWWIGLALAASISIVGQIGDLAESAVKRRFRIKDSGDIIPGHGGLMDRLDSLTFAALLVFAVGLVHAGYGAVASGLLHW
jgi:phosphatidate cytidylyltransferase